MSRGTCSALVAVAYRGGPSAPEKAYTSTYHCPLGHGHPGSHELPRVPHDAIDVRALLGEDRGRSVTGLGDKLRALRLACRVEGGDPLLGDVWLDVSGLQDALADALDALAEDHFGDDDAENCPGCCALAAVARQLGQDGAA